MINIKSLKWGYGIVVALTVGLSGCYMEEQNSHAVDYSSHDKMTANTGVEHKAVQKSYASKDPVQKATPGPKRAAAPQLPVIQ